MDDTLPAFFLCVTKAELSYFRSDLAFMQQFSLARLPQIVELVRITHAADAVAIQSCYCTRPCRAVHDNCAAQVGDAGCDESEFQFGIANVEAACSFFTAEACGGRWAG
jgi:hypothetical protein